MRPAIRLLIIVHSAFMGLAGPGPGTALCDVPARETSARETKSETLWRELEPGLDWREASCRVEPASSSSALRVQILRMDPAHFKLRLLNASASEKGRPLSARDWCWQEGLLAAITPSMFAKDLRASVSLMKTKGHINNPYMSKDNSVLVFDCKSDSLPELQIVDRVCQDFQALAPHYYSQVQSIRMLDCRGRNTWYNEVTVKGLSLIGQDERGHLLFIYIAGEVSLNRLTPALRRALPGLVRLQYGEGGQVAQFYLDHPRQRFSGVGGNAVIFSAVGSHAAGFNASEADLHAPPVPNVLGILRRTVSDELPREEFPRVNSPEVEDR